MNDIKKYIMKGIPMTILTICIGLLLFWLVDTFTIVKTIVGYMLIALVMGAVSFAMGVITKDEMKISNPLYNIPAFIIGFVELMIFIALTVSLVFLMQYEIIQYILLGILILFLLALITYLMGLIRATFQEANDKENVER